MYPDVEVDDLLLYVTRGSNTTTHLDNVGIRRGGVLMLEEEKVAEGVRWKLSTLKVPITDVLLGQVN